MLRVSPTGNKSWYVQLDRNRKRKISDAGLLSASVARYRARDLLVRQTISEGKSPGTKDKRTLGQYLEGPYLQLKNQVSLYGKRDIRRLCRALGTLCEERLEQVGVSHLEHWKLKRSRNVRLTTVNRELAMLKTAFDQALEWGFVAYNPARSVKLRKDSTIRIPRVLSQEERTRLEDILSHRNDRFSTLIQLALNTGMRRNELFSLRWKDVYFGPFPSVLVEKSSARHHNKSRRIPLNSIASSSLAQWQAARSNRAYLVFPGPSGGQLKSINTAWKRLMFDAEIKKFSLNDCRDDFAVRLVKAGVPLVQVRDLLGHSSIASTEKYALFAPGKLTDAVALLS